MVCLFNNMCWMLNAWRDLASPCTLWHRYYGHWLKHLPQTSLHSSVSHSIESIKFQKEGEIVTMNNKNYRGIVHEPLHNLHSVCMFNIFCSKACRLLTGTISKCPSHVVKGHTACRKERSPGFQQKDVWSLASDRDTIRHQTITRKTARVL